MRVFIAIDLPEELKEKIFRIYNKFKFIKAKFVEKENLHITLKFLGELPPNKVNEIKEALRSIEFDKFRIKIKGLGAFPDFNNIRVLWIGVTDGKDRLLELQRKVEVVCKKFGFALEKEYVPHVTIARIKQVFNREKFSEIIDELKNIDFGYFEVKEFKLKQSILRPQGPLYLDIEKYSLK